MRVLVTGAAGFVGSHLAPRLAAAGHQVVGTYLQEPPADPSVDWRPLDLLERRAVEELIDQVRPEAVVHLAALSHVGRSWREPAPYYRVNVDATGALLDLVGSCRVVFASSAEVYGAVPEGEQPITELRPPAPASPYAMTKAFAERLALAAGAVVVRSFNIIGPGQSSEFALPAFAGQLADIRAGRERPVLRVGNLQARRDFTAVDDALDAYELLLEGGEGGTVYNLGSGRAISIEEALHRLILVSGVQARIEVDPERLRPVDVPLLCADSSRLRALGWSPTVELDAALERLWRSVAEAE